MAEEAPSRDSTAAAGGELVPGSVVAGKFRVERPLARGGMGAVYECTHLGLGERVALKVLRADMGGEDKVRARFLKEAQAAARLRSEHVARVLDVDSLPEGLPYIVMEYLDGYDLGTYLSTGQTASVKDAVAWVVQACAGLAEAHAKGIVHRDVKPENLFLARDEHGGTQIKLLDFGISKLALTGSPLGPGGSAVETKEMLGTPVYMSPEHVRSTRSVDHRADIWALGAVLYELLAGRPPFYADSIPEVCALILEATPEPLGVRRGDLPAGLPEVVMRCLEKRPDARFQSVVELATALAPFSEGLLDSTLARMRAITGSSSETTASRSRPAAFVETLPSSPFSSDPGRADPMSRTVLASPVPPAEGRIRRIALVGGGVVMGAFALWVLLRPAGAPTALPDREGSSRPAPPIVAAPSVTGAATTGEAAPAAPAVVAPAPVASAVSSAPPAGPLPEPHAQRAAPAAPRRVAPAATPTAPVTRPAPQPLDIRLER